ncbi:MAG: type II toxin-antitoxin system Phd/YefM family antitoxin [Betaproteobacteria bacterium]|nr:type II toxin-antitoxin system Phd/YefM family antitoxin [Betaproteobacteria bacterium]
MKSTQNSWAVQDAKARFSEFLDACLRHGPQTVTRRGAREAVLVPIREYERLKSGSKPSLKDLLLTGEHRFEIEITARGQSRRRIPEGL